MHCLDEPEPVVTADPYALSVRTVSESSLERTREGAWADSRAALEPLALDSRERVLELGRRRRLERRSSSNTDVIRSERGGRELRN
ncbi:hypothetical protein [Natrarchaeobaculum aegyptiacum]|uniref:Uncharacterized protein n=1 Tax=Natrarchaeobaculum aegyptiacum TaxID=745377 RepID=A0A2Z2HV49_9EURY|nr:hypothetical protein [Natrarchaeobaculum aegyptiacum]ARS90653.1 hypothetical protein B1756_13565 [Natrarchaeobaculum aegyptiacum]